MSQLFIKYLLIGSLILLAAALWKRDTLPVAHSLGSALLEEPDQRPVAKASFKVAAGGIDYEVKPLFSYDLNGLVVSKHDSRTWWDYIHKAWNDALNVVDLCVVWGNNVRNDAYRDMQFSSGQFVCNWQTSSQETFEAFDQTAISNNHLLTNDRRIAEVMRSVRVGDQIHFQGYLVEYSHNHGFPFKRGTSTVRTDTGNGACETVYVESFDIVRRSNGLWRNLVWVSVALMITSVFGWFLLPPTLPTD